MNKQKKSETNAEFDFEESGLSRQKKALIDRLSNIIEAVPDAVITADHETKIVFFNSASQKLFGYLSEELSGMPLSNILPEKYCTSYPEVVNATGEKDGLSHISGSIEVVGQRKDGSKFPAQLLSSAWRSDEKTYRTYVIHDLTEKKRKEEDLHKSKEKMGKEYEDLTQLFLQVESIKKEWERTIDCVGDLIVLTDEHGKIRRCNKTFKEIAKRPYEDILGKDWGELLFGRHIETSAFGSQGTELFHPPSSRWFIIKAYPFRDARNREISGEAVMMHDSTELRAITRELEKKNVELEQAYADLKAAQSRILQQEKMASIGQLAAGVAHEINNPIGFISSNLGTLDKYISKITEFLKIQSEVLDSVSVEKSVSDNLMAKRKQLKLDYVISDVWQLIKESLDGADRVKKIVQDLKSFSRTDEEYKLADINAGIESTISIVWNEIKYKAVLKKECGNIPLTQCNLGQLNQVFMNILVNAAHAIEKQGAIVVKTWHDSGQIYISISDTGSGIPEDKLGRIFEPFFTTKDVGKGTGLGLSIAYEIIKKHNGDITVESAAGKGTTFTIRIPAVTE